MLGILHAGTVLVLITAAMVDVRKGKIPNVLLIILILLQIGSETLSFLLNEVPVFGGMELGNKIIVSFCLFAVLYPFFMFGGLGAGDIKLLVVTAFNLDKPFEYVLITFAVGSCISISKLFIKGNNRKSIVHLSVPILIAYLVTVYLGR